MLCRLQFVAAAATLLATGALAEEAAPAAANGCLASGDSSLQARVRGAIDADINWSNAQMTCEGGMRPNNKGLRVSIAGPVVLNESAATAAGKPVQLRFVFGITLRDIAAGVAQALPTNLTVIVEGQQQLFATLGDDKCAVEQLEVTPLFTAVADRGSGGGAGGGRQRIHARGYCIGPATDLQGLQRVLVSTFEFTSQVKSGDEP
jgi:hypothetical protein